MQKIMIALVACISILSACDQGNISENKEWGAIYKKYGIDSAAFEVRDHSKDAIVYYNKARGNKRLSPASTFKIMASLIALETSVAPDEDLMIKWDGIVRPQDKWNKDMNMREAFATSSEPYYKELMKRVGATEIKKWLDSTEYGNMQVGNDVEKFWTNNTLLITPDEQVGFIKKLYFDELPFSKRTMRIVKAMMLQEETKGYRWYYKTGLYVDSSKQMGWLVGFVEDSVHHPYFFANNFETKDTSLDLGTMRQDLTKEIFQSFGMMK
jgi:beta-lactamase class D